MSPPSPRRKASEQPWILRSGRAEDAEEVVELWRAAGAEPGITDDPTSVQKLVDFDPDALVVAESESKIVGSVIAGFDGWRASLYRLAVHPGFRRRGLGKALVGEAERRLVQRGARRVNALVVAAHDQAVAFWEAVGYPLDHRIGRHVRNLDTATPEAPSSNDGQVGT